MKLSIQFILNVKDYLKANKIKKYIKELNLFKILIQNNKKKLIET